MKKKSMKCLNCSDFGWVNCGFIAKGRTTKEVKEIMTNHIIENHMPIIPDDKEINRIERQIERKAIYENKNCRY